MDSLAVLVEVHLKYTHLPLGALQQRQSND